MAEKIVGIYQITCTANGKKYIGQSIDIKRRFTQHKTQTSNKNLKEDLEQYGNKAFTFEILEECTVKELTAREDYYLKTVQPEYNILFEGRTVFVSDETREKQRQAKLGKKLTPEHCSKISQSNLGNTMSEETRRKHFKAVRCIETGQVFESLKQAAEFAGISYNCISRVVHGRRQSSAGFHWEFVDKTKSLSNNRKPCKPISEKTRRKRFKTVRYIETGSVFESLIAAAEFLGIKYPNISAVLHGKQMTSGGFHWEYIDLTMKCNEELSKNMIRGRKKSELSLNAVKEINAPVRCIETQKMFSNVKLASASCGVLAKNILKALSGERETAGGFHWEYLTA